MMWIIGIFIYLLSIVSLRGLFRLFSSKYYDIWLNEDCKAEVMWFVPWINTVYCLWLLLILVSHSNFRKKYQGKNKSKWLNGDL